MFGTLADIRNELRVRLGLPDRGDSGDTRLNTIINMALRQMWSEMPKALLSQEMRFVLEKPVTVGDKVTFGPTVDNRVVYQTGVGTGDFWATDGTLRGRTVELLQGGTYYYRRIQDVYADGTTQYLVLDHPLDLTASTEIPYRIITAEYPYPASVQQIVDVVIDPDSNPHPLVQSAWQADLTTYKSTIGFRAEGRPELYCRGDFFQLESPNYQPKVATEDDIEASLKWGFDATQGEMNTETNGSATFNGGPAGKFQYIVMHVWGRRPFYDLTYKSKSSTVLPPFYQSAPSKESDAIETKWGQGAINITTPNVDYVYGYGEKPTAKSHHHFGYEKFIFRKRLSVETITSYSGITGPSSIVQEIEADSVYYLWKVIPGYQTKVTDNGSEDPVDRRFTLEAFNGHFHIRFDRQPTEKTPVLIRTFSRPPLLRYDTDTPRIPPDCYDALYALTASYLVGDRDGEPARKSLYFGEYQTHLKRLRQTYNVAGHHVGTFANGLSARGSRFSPRRNKPITEIT